jgi:hypothetical protein
MPRALTFDDVLEIGSKLPDVEKSATYGVSALKIGKSLLTCPAINKSAEPNSIMVRLPFEDRNRRLAERPDVYYLPAHYEPYPCVVARLPKIRRSELRELLGAGWRFVIERAPTRAKKRAQSRKRPKR